jgi:sigma-B regulation protein RsbU (phosphoserine phosphatase)
MEDTARPGTTRPAISSAAAADGSSARSTGASVVGSEPRARSPVGRASERETLRTLFELGRQVMAVLDLDELLQRIPELLARLIRFEAFAVYLLEERRDRRNELRIAYSIGYPEATARSLRLKVGEGLVGLAAATREPVLVNDVTADPRYVEAVPGTAAELVVPLVHQQRVLGALNLLSLERDAFSPADVDVVMQFASHVAVALVNARLFERERRDAETFELLAEIGREVSSILELEELLARIAQVTRRVIDYRTFGILLLNEQTGELELKLAVKYDERVTIPKVKLGEGLVGYAALHREPVLVPDVARDPRYIKVVEDVRSELVVPMLVRDRCIGVIDLESPELDAFDKRHVEILTVLAGQAAVAIENARLYEALRANEERLEKELRFAQRVQMALLPAEPPKRLRGVEVGAAFAPARELGGDFYDLLTPEAHTLVVAVGDVSGKGVPAALYGTFAGELVRSRTFRRRFIPERSDPASILASINAILRERRLEEYYCTLCYAVFDLKRRTLTLANSGLPYPLHLHEGRASSIELAGVPLGSFDQSVYEQRQLALQAGDLFVFYTDGIVDALDEEGREFSLARLCAIIEEQQSKPAQQIVEAVFEAIDRFRGGAPRADDTTLVVVKITA